MPALCQTLSWLVEIQTSCSCRVCVLIPGLLGPQISVTICKNDGSFSLKNQSLCQPLIQTDACRHRAAVGWGRALLTEFCRPFPGFRRLKAQAYQVEGPVPCPPPPPQACSLLSSPPQHLTVFWVRLPCDFPFILDRMMKQ